MKHAAYMLDAKMAGTVDKAKELLLDIRARLAPQRGREMARLAEIKAERETTAATTNSDTSETSATPGAGGATAKLEEWDTAFYSRLLKERDYSVDQEVVRRYFPLPRVKKEVFALFEKLLDVKIRRVVGPSAAAVSASSSSSSSSSSLTTGANGDDDVEESALHAVCWHEDVELYVIREGSSSGGGGGGGAEAPIVGHFFLDLHPRPGKYGHQCVLPIAPAFSRRSGATAATTKATFEATIEATTEAAVRPVCAILGNMSAPPADGSSPALLRFDEVKTFMHEFGHVVHCLLTRSPHSRLSWAWPMVPWPGGVENDFLEVPSMLFEQWAFDERVLAQISGHYAETTTPAVGGAAAAAEGGGAVAAPLPPALVSSIVATKHVMEGVSWTRFIGMALFALLAHSSAPPYTYTPQASATGGATGGGKEPQISGLSLKGLFDAVMLDVAGRDGASLVSQSVRQSVSQSVSQSVCISARSFCFWSVDIAFWFHQVEVYS